MTTHARFTAKALPFIDIASQRQRLGSGSAASSIMPSRGYLTMDNSSWNARCDAGKQSGLVWDMREAFNIFVQLFHPMVLDLAIAKIEAAYSTSDAIERVLDGKMANGAPQRIVNGVA